MRLLTGFLLGAAVLAAAPATAQGNDLYLGGTLHEVTADVWIAADEANRYATSSEFVGHFFSGEIGDVAELELSTEQMHACIDEQALLFENADEIVFDIASACAVDFGWPNVGSN